VIAAHCDSCAASCSSTIRTARARTSGENLVDLGMAPSSQGLEPPERPARFRSSHRRAWGFLRSSAEDVEDTHTCRCQSRLAALILGAALHGHLVSVVVKLHADNSMMRRDCRTEFLKIFIRARIRR